MCHLLTTLFLLTTCLSYPGLTSAEEVVFVGGVSPPRSQLSPAIVFYYIDNSRAMNHQLWRRAHFNTLEIPPEHRRIRQQGERLKVNFPALWRRQSYWSLNRT